MAQIKLTAEECIEYFYNALCNGLPYVGRYGLELNWDEDKYEIARMNWVSEHKDKTPCFEDVLIQILKDGGELTIEDLENGEEDEYTKSITLKDVIERVPNTPMLHLTDMINETDDATTADVILQTVFYNEVIFG